MNITEDEVETRLIWSRKHGFNLELPPMDDDEQMSVEQLFLGWLFIKSSDPTFVEQVAAEYAALSKSN